LQRGVAWPNPRFTVSGDCVTDNLTGLMWAKNANLANATRTWQGALDYVAAMNGGQGLCGHQDWRLPNVRELASLPNYGEDNSTLWLTQQGFENVQGTYWSSSTYADDPENAWFVVMWSGGVHADDKDGHLSVWPVRAGQ
jgi:hypothetical protein